MEEFIGKLWHNWVTKTAAGHYPEAAVKMSEVEKTAGILFRAFGGDPGLKVAAATADQHGARRRWLQRVAGSGEKVAHARRDAETLRLPPEIAAFPEKSLNRDLYLWLAALAASDVAPQRPWFIRNQLASQAALARYRMDPPHAHPAPRMIMSVVWPGGARTDPANPDSDGHTVANRYTDRNGDGWRDLPDGKGGIAKMEPFLTGLVENNEYLGRPVDVLQREAALR